MKKKSHKKTRKAAKPAKQDPTTLVAIYAVLAVLVIATSFYTGYLVGKGGDGMPKKMGGSGELTIVEYSDFQCPFCTRALPTVKQIKENYPNVEFVYKHFPLESIHPLAFNAAVAAECVREAKGDDAFWTYHDTLFANQGALDIPNLKQYAKSQGVDIDSCLDSQETAATVRAHMDEARSRGVGGTPSFWVGDELVVGAVPYEQIKVKIDEKLSGKVAPPPAAPAPAAPTAPADLDDGTFVMGNKNAPVTLIEFTDYQCPFCNRAHTQSFPQIKSQYIDTGKVRYSVRHFPLNFHQHAQKASEAVECAGKVGGASKYWEYHDALFANQGALDVASLKKYAADLGVNINTCLDSGEFEQQVKADLAAGSAAGVRGTPSFFVNGKNLNGAQPFSSFKAAIDAELQ